ncbi:MAG: hypothetical protein Q4F41_07830 [Eubacteriales bacterium]|nr:hypothetical protein [Eubacteriales bacterium]
MRGIFCSQVTKSDEEYCEVLKKRKTRMVGLFLLGLAAMGISAWAEWSGKAVIADYMLGVYCGGGTGLMLGAVILWFQQNALLKNERKRKERRMEEADERVAEISNRAYRTAATMLLVGLYLTGLVGGLFEPLMVKILLFLVCIFMFSYLVAFRYYEKKM